MVSITSNVEMNGDEVNDNGDNVKENLVVNLLKNLNAQFDQQLYCDITLVAGVDGTK